MEARQNRLWSVSFVQFSGCNDLPHMLATVFALMLGLLSDRRTDLKSWFRLDKLHHIIDGKLTISISASFQTLGGAIVDVNELYCVHKYFRKAYKEPVLGEEEAL